MTDVLYRELSFKKGDILLVRRRINDDWLEGEFQDSVGIFPLNHVELFPLEANEQENVSSEYELELDDEGEAIVKYDFVPQKTFELQLRKVNFADRAVTHRMHIRLSRVTK